MPKKNDFKLDVVSVRLVKDAPIYSEHTFNNPTDIAAVMGECMCQFDREVVCVVNLRSDLKPINVHFASVGSLNEAMAHPRELFKSSILSNAASMMLIHCHPSGNVFPSKADTMMTDRMNKLCELMGIPLVNALFGMEGVFYLTAFITVFNISVWTQGIVLISGERDMKKVVKVFYSPTMIAIVLGMISFFLRLRLPSVPAKAVDYIAELNTPLAMIVSGVTIADTNVPALLRKPSVYYVSFLRLLLFPLIVSSALAPFGIEEKVRMTIVIAAAAPPAAMCTLQSIRYGKNSLYSSEVFAFGTLLSAATLPLMVTSAEYLTKLIGRVC